MGNLHMPISSERLIELQAECLADDIDIPEEATAWAESDVVAFFESGGTELPRKPGLAGAEIIAFYDMKRQEAASSSAVMVAALARTLYGDVQPAAPTVA